jgi:DNA-binding MarR family transcriptional regulator
MNLSALATKFGAIPSSASRLCDRLEASGLVQREVPADNRREVRLSLTREGRRRLESFDDARREDLARVLERMSAEARAALLDGLREFSTAAQEARDASA